VLKVMFLSKVRVILWVLAAAVLLTAGAGLLVAQRAEVKVPPPAPPLSVPAATEKPSQTPLENPQAEAYAGVKNLSEALRVLKERLALDGKGDYAALLPEDKVREAIQAAIQSYDARMRVAEDSRLREHFDQWVKPKLLEIVDRGTWPPQCWFGTFYSLGDGRGVIHGGCAVRLHVETPGARFSGFALPILDAFYGMFY
jgi:hypothetical protein